MGTHPIFESDFDCLTVMPATVFIGDLPDSARQRDIEDFFRKHGKIEQIRLRNRFGFVDFRSSADAEDAVRDMDGERLCGERIRLEISDGRGRRDRSRDSGGGGGRSKPHRTRFTLEIENLSSRVNWADLKDMMRQAGEVTYTDAHQRMGKNRGEVCFYDRDGLHAAKKKFDGEEVNGRKIKVRITEDGSRSRSRSRSNSRSRSRTRSRSRSRRRTRSRSRSASRSRSRSRS